MAPKVLLLGGTSHVGKSTLARRLADRLGCRHLSTDELARHPGRPWRDDGTQLPADVAGHYQSLSTTEQLDAVLLHYAQNVWPIVDAIVRSHLNNAFDPSLILEGSAVLPELVGAAQLERTSALFLTAPDDVIRQRISDSSGHAHRPPAERNLIDAFARRSLAFGKTVEASAAERGLQCVDVSSQDAFETLAEMMG